MSNTFWDDIAKILSQSKIDIDEVRSFSCGLCGEIIKEAVQIICGCKFCRRCIENYLKNGNKTCPCRRDEDCLQVKLTNMEDIHIETETNKRILQLIVRCPNQDCNYEAELSEMSDHYKSCDKTCAIEIDLKEAILILQKENEKLIGTVSSFKEQMDIDRKRISSLEKEIQDMNETMLQICVDSNICEPFVWRLDKYPKIISERKNVYSAPFYVTKYGYKARLVLTPGGSDGLYLGIYFQLCKGEYDPLLRWLFSYSVAFTILSQKLGHDDHIHNMDFPPDQQHLKSYLRPLEDYNPGYGAIQFFDIESFSSSDIYLSDDAFFIKFTVSKV